VPYLFTLWWLKWNRTDPLAYPLPAIFSSLSDLEVEQYHSVTLLVEYDHAVTALWDAGHYNPLLLLMLRLFLSRPEERNNCQHPPPTSDFARSFLKKSLLLAKQDLSATSLIIDSGTLKEKDELKFFFRHEDGREVVDQNKKLDQALRNWLDSEEVRKASAPESEKGDAKRELQIAEEDKGRARKRVKHISPA
jgi:hypothetical protein